MNNDTPLDLPMPQLDERFEEDKASSPLVVAVSPKNLTVISKDTSGEWKNVQSLLTKMGLELFSAPNNINLARNSSKPRRKKGTREVQNLEFNVNYE